MNRKLHLFVGLMGIWGSAQATLYAQTETVAAPAAVLPGHSAHGESFNEGPRQRAYLMGQTGNVSFPATSTVPQVQEFINQGVGQLYGFWYYEAERSFRQAAALDPQCGTAYWGMAMANTNNHARAKAFIAEAAKRKTGLSTRENQYIDALDAFHKADVKKDKERYENYTKALERISLDYPADLEAKAFLCLQLWDNRSHGLPITSHLAINALLQEVLAKNPLHPCHHFVIHLWDYEKAELALASAARCGQSAPAIAHMWHMSGHIYSRLDRFDDAAWQQSASARVDHAYMQRDRILPDQIHNYAHNNEWCVRDLSHIGQVRAAIELSKNLCELPRHPKYNTLQKSGGSASYGRLRLFEELTRFELWDELITLSQTSYLEPTEIPLEQIKRLRFLGSAYARRGTRDAVPPILADLQARLQAELTQQSAADDKKREEEGAKLAQEQVAKLAETAKLTIPPAPELPVAAPPVKAPTNPQIEALQKALAEIEGHLAVAEGNFAHGLERLKAAGGVDALTLARIQYQAGDKEAALKAAEKAVNGRKNQTQPLALLTDLYLLAGDTSKATETFQKLRDLSTQLEVTASPVFARLTPFAVQQGLPEDWRLIKSAATDVGDRPALDSLGPLRWSPPPAPDFTLKTAQGESIAMQQYRGKPVVVIFFLGHGCLHCTKQLQAFVPKAQEFAQAGISLVGVSTDGQAGLEESLKSYGDQPFPFPLLTNESLNVFQAYRAYDDFEKKPLHATLLIDGAGQVRWHDISYEPFMEADFVLQEARRLLSLTPPSTAPAAPMAVSSTSP